MSRRILIIDADETLTQQVVEALQARGLDAVAASDSTTGFDLARTEPRPDLIVVNVEIQPTNGWSLCTKLRRDDELKAVPLVLTSADSNEETFEKHKKLKTRANEYLFKPYEIPDLLRACGAHLGLPDLAEEPVAAEGDFVVEDEPLGGEFEASADEPIAVDDDEPLVTDEAPLAEGDPLATFDEAEHSLSPDDFSETEAAPEGDPLAGYGDGLEGDALSAEDPLAAADPLGEGLGTADPLDSGDVAVIEDVPEAGDDVALDESIPPPPVDGDDTTVVESAHADAEWSDTPAEAPAIDDIPSEFESGGDEAGTLTAGEDPLGGYGDTEQVATLEARVAELEAELDGYRAAQGSKDAETGKLRKDLTARDRELRELRDKLRERENELDQLRENEARLTAETAAANADKVRRDAASKSLTTRAEQAVAHAKKVERELAAVREEAKQAAALKARVAELEGAAAEASQASAFELEQVREQVTTLTGERDEARRAKEAVDAELATARADADALRADLDEARASAEKALQSAGDLQARLEAAEAESRATADQLAKVREALKSALDVLA